MEESEGRKNVNTNRCGNEHRKKVASEEARVPEAWASWWPGRGPPFKVGWVRGEVNLPFVAERFGRKQEKTKGGRKGGNKGGKEGR